MPLSTHSTTMALQIVVVACMMAVAAAQYGGYAPARYAAPEPYDPNPRYDFEYSVRDDSTYDIKSQKESRDGDNVYGVYELVEPDGTRRVVEYSDTGYGFQANVQRTPGGYAAPAYGRPAAYAAPAYRPAAYAAPAYRPAAYAAPAYRPAAYAAPAYRAAAYAAPAYARPAYSRY